MKTITFQDLQRVNLVAVLKTAQSEPVMLLTTDGREFILSQADRFEEEVEALRKSRRFQTFLDERLGCQTRISLEELEREVDEEIARTAGHLVTA